MPSSGTSVGNSLIAGAIIAPLLDAATGVVGKLGSKIGLGGQKLDDSAAPGEKPKYPPVTVEQHMREMYRRTY